MPSACIASLMTYSRSIGPTAALPSPPREKGVLPDPLFDTQIAAMAAGFGEQIAYDALTAGLFESAGVPAILVGDSASSVVYGHTTTLPVTVDELMADRVVLDQSVSIGGNEELVVQERYSKTVESNEQRSVGGTRSLKVGDAVVAGDGALALEFRSGRGRIVRPAAATLLFTTLTALTGAR